MRTQACASDIHTAPLSQKETTPRAAAPSNLRYLEAVIARCRCSLRERRAHLPALECTRRRHAKAAGVEKYVFSAALSCATTRPTVLEKSTVSAIVAFFRLRSFYNICFAHAAIAQLKSSVPRQEKLNFRWRPYHVEYTGSLPNSEVKRCRARLVLGWGTAREDLRVLPAFSQVAYARVGPCFFFFFFLKKKNERACLFCFGASAPNRRTTLVC